MFLEEHFFVSIGQLPAVPLGPSLLTVSFWPQPRASLRQKRLYWGCRQEMVHLSPVQGAETPSYPSLAFHPARLPAGKPGVKAQPQFQSTVGDPP